MIGNTQFGGFHEGLRSFAYLTVSSAYKAKNKRSWKEAEQKMVGSTSMKIDVTPPAARVGE